MTTKALALVATNHTLTFELEEFGTGRLCNVMGTIEVEMLPSQSNPPLPAELLPLTLKLYGARAYTKSGDLAYTYVRSNTQMGHFKKSDWWDVAEQAVRNWMWDRWDEHEITFLEQIQKGA